MTLPVPHSLRPQPAACAWRAEGEARARELITETQRVCIV